ncbi:MAG: DUF6491 family protein [Pseudomonadota bacterium]
MRRSNLVYSLSAIIAFAACASSNEATDKADPSADPLVGEPTDRICFRNTINGFREWDSGEGIILTRGVNDQFLVTFRGPCNIANRAQRIGLTSRFTTSGCVNDTDLIFLSDEVRPSRNPLSVQSCPVDEIFEYGVDDDDAETVSDET